MAHPVGVIKCSDENCDAEVKNHRWGKTKAEGWFFSKDGSENWCPIHLPAWVGPWREKRR